MRVSWLDLRFASANDEKAYKESNEKRLIYSSVTILFAWHSCLLVIPQQDGGLGLLHVLLLLTTCVLGATALLCVRSRCFRSLDWELIFITLGCSTFIMFPIIADDFLERTSKEEGQERYFQVLGSFVGVAYAIAIPFRASFSWVLLVSGLIACLISSSFLNYLDVMSSAIELGMCVLCWCMGWQLEASKRAAWQARHQAASKLCAVLPEEDLDVSMKLQQLDIDEIQPPARQRHHLAIGSTIPDFELQTTTGNFPLSQYLHSDPKMPWTILLSHPADFTPACTTEMGSCHDLGPQFAELGVKVIGVSCDSVEKHEAWSKDVLANMGITSDKLNFPIIADVDKTIVSALGLLDPTEKDSYGDPLPARALVVLHYSTVKLTSLYPASCGRNFDNLKWVLASLMKFKMGPMLAAEPNPIQLGATVPNLLMTTADGQIRIHDWLNMDSSKPWTMLFSLPAASNSHDHEGWKRLEDVAKAIGCKFIAIKCKKMSNQETYWNPKWTFPTIIDDDRKISTALDMLDTNMKEDGTGLPQLVSALVIMQGAKVRFSEIYSASASRSFNEVARILSSFQLTDAQPGLVTPVNWEEGERVLLHPSVSTDEAQKRFPGDVVTKELPSGKNYFRTVNPVKQ